MSRHEASRKGGGGFGRHVQKCKDADARNRAKLQVGRKSEQALDGRTDRSIPFKGLISGIAIFNEVPS